jgi:hypothetical protein
VSFRFSIGSAKFTHVGKKWTVQRSLRERDWNRRSVGFLSETGIRTAQDDQKQSSEASSFVMQKRKFTLPHTRKLCEPLLR